MAYFIIYIALLRYFCFFFFNDTATTEIYTLSLHDALPISSGYRVTYVRNITDIDDKIIRRALENGESIGELRSEEHTSELQSRLHLVCRLLLEKKKKQTTKPQARPTSSQRAVERH